MNERSALDALQHGDPAALHEIIQRYTPYVSAVIERVAMGYAALSDIEELAADVFVALWRDADRVLPGKLRPWLGAVARNKARDYLRSRRVELPLEEDVLPLTEDPLQDEAERMELRDAVRNAVLSMEQPDREIFLRHYYYFQPVRDIGLHMCIPTPTVKSRLRRGRQALKQKLIQGGFADGLPDQRPFGRNRG